MDIVRRPREWRPSPRLDGLPGYGRGRAGQSVTFRHRLGSNEAPTAPDILPGFNWQDTEINRYPDLRGDTLCDALSRRHDVGADMVAVAAGSIVLLDQLVRATCDPGDEIVTPWRSYEAYPIISGLAGARLVEVPLDPTGTADPDAIMAAAGANCRVVLICNPNNPTGTHLPDEVIDGLLGRLPDHVLVILDEAYADYAMDAAEAIASPARRLARHPNLAVLRTFSKAWGIAGMRVGYCLANAPVISAVQAVAPPFPLPTVAIGAALAALDRPERTAARVDRNAAERERLSAGLRRLGLPVAVSKANFVWLPVGSRAEALTAHFASASIAVRCFAGEGVRITTGTSADTDAVLAAASDWCDCQPGPDAFTG